MADKEPRLLRGASCQVLQQQRHCCDADQFCMTNAYNVNFAQDRLLYDISNFSCKAVLLTVLLQDQYVIAQLRYDLLVEMSSTWL